MWVNALRSSGASDRPYEGTLYCNKRFTSAVIADAFATDVAT